MIKSIEKRVSRGRLELTIETKIKDFYSHNNQVLREEEVYAIASEEHDIKEKISKPDHKVGNYKNLETKYAFKYRSSFEKINCFPIVYFQT